MTLGFGGLLALTQAMLYCEAIPEYEVNILVKFFC
jgi:hypothetical protein